MGERLSGHNPDKENNPTTNIEYLLIENLQETSHLDLAVDVICTANTEVALDQKIGTLDSMANAQKWMQALEYAPKYIVLEPVGQRQDELDTKSFLSYLRDFHPDTQLVLLSIQPEEYQEIVAEYNTDESKVIVIPKPYEPRELAQALNLKLPQETKETQEARKLSYEEQMAEIARITQEFQATQA